MEYEWPPQLDFKPLGDWCEFCEGRQSFDTHHFGTLLMEVYQMGITPEVDEFTKAFSKYFPKGIYENLCRYADDIPKDDVVPWVRRELSEMRSMLALELLESNSGQLKATEVFESEALINLIDHGNLRITHDRDQWVDRGSDRPAVRDRPVDRVRPNVGQAAADPRANECPRGFV